MINLMYLVLTAMLALNISSEILHAFKILNESMTKSNAALDSKNSETMFAFQVNEDRPEATERVKPFNDKAKDIKKKSDEVYAYLEDWKSKVITQSGGFVPGQPGVIKDEANIDASTLLLVEKKGGDDIKKQLNDLKTYIIGRFDNDTVKRRFNKELPLQTPDPEKDENNPQGDWSTGTFYHVPTLGVIALMSKLQSDVRNAEQMAINQLFIDADAKQIKFDAIRALAIPKTTYVLQNSPVEAEVMVAAYNKSVNPAISVSSGSVTIKDGVGTWKGTASGLGEQTVRGTLSLNLGDRQFKENWEFKYTVGTAGASMQLDKMNVFYIGVENPITVTAAGYSLEDVSVNIPGATLTTTAKGKYNVKVAPGGPQIINASIVAGTAAGRKEVASMPIRVKRIPDPIAKIDNKTGGPYPTNRLRAQLGIAAVLEGFEFDVRASIVSFEMAMKPRRGEYREFGLIGGPYFAGPNATNADARNYIENRAAIGDRVYFDNIKAKLPDGTTRTLNPISFTLN